MSKLLGRKTKLVVETENTVWERRKTRPLVVELKPDYMIIRIKGTRAAYTISYTGALNLAIRNEIFRKRMEKAKAKKNGTPK